jgi:hypothetical protein
MHSAHIRHLADALIRNYVTAGRAALIAHHFADAAAVVGDERERAKWTAVADLIAEDIEKEMQMAKSAKA